MPKADFAGLRAHIDQKTFVPPLPQAALPVRRHRAGWWAIGLTAASIVALLAGSAGAVGLLQRQAQSGPAAPASRPAVPLNAGNALISNLTTLDRDHWFGLFADCTGDVVKTKGTETITPKNPRTCSSVRGIVGTGSSREVVALPRKIEEFILAGAQKQEGRFSVEISALGAQTLALHASEVDGDQRTQLSVDRGRTWTDVPATRSFSEFPEGGRWVPCGYPLRVLNIQKCVPYVIDLKTGVAGPLAGAPAGTRPFADEGGLWLGDDERGTSYVSSDRGRTWQQRTMPRKQTNGWITRDGQTIYSSQPDRVRGGTDLFRSTDGGRTWTTIEATVGMATGLLRDGTLVAEASGGPNVSGAPNWFWLSQDRGATFSKSMFPKGVFMTPNVLPDGTLTALIFTDDRSRVAGIATSDNGRDWRTISL